MKNCSCKYYRGNQFANSTRHQSIPSSLLIISTFGVVPRVGQFWGQLWSLKLNSHDARYSLRRGGREQNAHQSEAARPQFFSIFRFTNFSGDHSTCRAPTVLSSRVHLFIGIDVTWRGVNVSILSSHCPTRWKCIFGVKLSRDLLMCPTTHNLSGYGEEARRQRLLERRRGRNEQ